MISNGFDYNTLYMEAHLRELRARADRDRLFRQARRPHGLRRHVGRMLVTAGETLAR